MIIQFPMGNLVCCRIKPHDPSQSMAKIPCQEVVAQLKYRIICGDSSQIIFIAEDHSIKRRRLNIGRSRSESRHLSRSHTSQHARSLCLLPELCYIQWVQGEFQDSAETVDGRLQHRWVDAEQDAIPEDFQPFHARSVSLTAPQAGLCCRIDLLEGDGSLVTPVEYKRGEAPKMPPALTNLIRSSFVPRLLPCERTAFSPMRASYTRPLQGTGSCEFDLEIVGRTRRLIEDLRRTAERGEMPPPLHNSSRCNRCSLAGICLFQMKSVNLLREIEIERSLKKRPECCFRPKR